MTRPRIQALSVEDRRSKKERGQSTYLFKTNMYSDPFFSPLTILIQKKERLG